MIEPKVDGVYQDPSLPISAEQYPNNYYIALKDDAGRKLDIWLGQCEAWTVAFALEHYQGSEQPPRLMAYQFIQHLLQTTTAQLDYACLTKLESEQYFAVAAIRFQNATSMLDIATYDALALAVCCKKPIYADEQLWSRISVSGDNADR